MGTTKKKPDPAAAKRNEAAQKAAIDHALKVCGVPSMLNGSDISVSTLFDDMAEPIATEREGVVERFKTKLNDMIPGGMAVLGKPGCGKTTMLCAAVLGYCRKGILATYVRVQDIGYQVKATYASDLDDEQPRNEREVLDRWVNPAKCRVLAIDDVLGYSDSPFERRLLAYILDVRMAEGLVTILGVQAEEPRHLFGKLRSQAYIADRIKYGPGLVPVPWGNLRRRPEGEDEPHDEAEPNGNGAKAQPAPPAPDVAEGTPPDGHDDPPHMESPF